MTPYVQKLTGWSVKPQDAIHGWPLLKRTAGPAGIPCASGSVASAGGLRLGCLCSLGAGIVGRGASSIRLLLSGRKNGSRANRFADPAREPWDLLSRAALVQTPSSRTLQLPQERSAITNRGTEPENTLLSRFVAASGPIRLICHLETGYGGALIDHLSSRSVAQSWPKRPGRGPLSNATRARRAPGFCVWNAGSSSRVV